MNRPSVHPKMTRVTARTQAAKVLAKPYIRRRLDRTHKQAERKRRVVDNQGSATRVYVVANSPVTNGSDPAAAGVLLLDRVNPAKAYRQVDWPLLVMFAGLFVVVHAFEVQVLDRAGVQHWTALRDHPVDVLSVVSAVLSNVVSNVPAVLLFKPVIAAMPPEAHESAWLALAMSSTLAGNLTVLGSVANLIVVENARRQGVVISLWDYCRVGVPVTLLTLLIGVGWLLLVPY